MIVLAADGYTCRAGAELTPSVTLNKTGLDATELGVIVNDADPVSVNIGNWYMTQRGIPAANLIHVRLPVNQPSVGRETFNAARAEVERQTGAKIQAYALAWLQPYRVDCMSITSAFALGFDEAYCSNKPCAETRHIDYFDSKSVAPYTDHHFRPTIMLAGQTLQDVKQLIARGIASDFTYPTGTAYLLNTSDKHRTVRSVYFDQIVKALGSTFHLEQANADSIKNKSDVLFYFTGIAKVSDLSSLQFLPGAIADHLTSAGGMLTGSGQMSILRWLEAGATGSYGTVVEPCNHLAKFPHPGIAMWRYGEGNTLIEAYWKSVAAPGEGVFVGEPLAKPFAPRLRELATNHVILDLYSPQARSVRLESAVSAIGPFRPTEVYPVGPGRNEVRLRLPDSTLYYRIAF